MRRVVIFRDYTLQYPVSLENLHTIIISLNVLITEKSKSLRIENNCVACWILYVTFSSFSLVYQICSLIQEVFWKDKIIKTTNWKPNLNLMKKIKLWQNKHVFLLLVTNLSFFDSFLAFLEYFQLKHLVHSF